MLHKSRVSQTAESHCGVFTVTQEPVAVWESSVVAGGRADRDVTLEVGQNRTEPNRTKQNRTEQNRPGVCVTEPVQLFLVPRLIRGRLLVLWNPSFLPNSWLASGRSLYRVSFNAASGSERVNPDKNWTGFVRQKTLKRNPSNADSRTDQRGTRETQVDQNRREHLDVWLHNQTLSWWFCCNSKVFSTQSSWCWRMWAGFITTDVEDSGVASANQQALKPTCTTSVLCMLYDALK